MEVFFTGIIPEDLQSAPEADPIWNLNLVFTKSTIITYGPWADKQRYIIINACYYYRIKVTLLYCYIVKCYLSAI